jgi:hypothetical protein
MADQTGGNWAGKTASQKVALKAVQKAAHLAVLTEWKMAVRRVEHWAASWDGKTAELRV